MSRNSAGTYTLPLPPVAAGETIEAEWANDTTDDIAQALTDSLDRYGRGGMLAPFKFVDGTVSAPGMAFTNEPTSGFYREAQGVVCLALQGVQAWKANAAGLTSKEFFSTVAPTSGSSLVNKDYVTTALTAYQPLSGAWNTSNFNPGAYQPLSGAWNTSNFNPAAYQPLSGAWNTGNFNPNAYAPLGTDVQFHAVYATFVGSRAQSGFFNVSLNLDIGKAPAMARGFTATDGSGSGVVSFPFNIPSPRIVITPENAAQIVHAQILSSSSSGFYFSAYVWNGSSWVGASINVHWHAITESVSI